MNKYEQIKAITQAILSGERMYVAPGGKGVLKLPKCQSTGTKYQQETYARITAMKLLEA
jgi:hypothetical protein